MSPKCHGPAYHVSSESSMNVSCCTRPSHGDEVRRQTRRGVVVSLAEGDAGCPCDGERPRIAPRGRVERERVRGEGLRRRGGGCVAADGCRWKVEEEMARGEEEGCRWEMEVEGCAERRLVQVKATRRVEEQSERRRGRGWDASCSVSSARRHHVTWLQRAGRVEVDLCSDSIIEAAEASALDVNLASPGRSRRNVSPTERYAPAAVGGAPGGRAPGAADGSARTLVGGDAAQGGGLAGRPAQHAARRAAP